MERDFYIEFRCTEREREEDSGNGWLVMVVSRYVGIVKAGETSRLETRQPEMRGEREGGRRESRLPLRESSLSLISFLFLLPSFLLFFLSFYLLLSPLYNLASRAIAAFTSFKQPVYLRRATGAGRGYANCTRPVPARTSVL